MIFQSKSMDKIFKPKGYTLVAVLLFLFILVLVGNVFISLVVFELKVSKNDAWQTNAFYIAQTGVEKAIWQVNQPGSTYTGETNTVFAGGTFTVSVVDGAIPNTKEVTSTGRYPQGVVYPAERIIKTNLKVSASTTTYSFKFAVQIGDLGLNMNSNSVINGNAYSNGNITGNSNSRINGDAYAVGSISSPNPNVSGVTRPGSPPSAMPTVDYNFWKNEANINNDPYIGDFSLNGGTYNIGPKKIQGNFTINSNTIVIMDGPIWVTGNFMMNSNTTFRLNEGFGSKGCVIIVDGTVVIDSNTYLYPTSATPKGYIMVVSTNTANPAISINSNAAGAIFYALEGSIQINSNGHAYCVVGRGLQLNSNATLDYDAGLASAEFTTGPGGRWEKDVGTWEDVY